MCPISIKWTLYKPNMIKLRDSAYAQQIKQKHVQGTKQTYRYNKPKFA